MAWTEIPTRSSADPASSADYNQKQANENALKGGTSSAAPIQTLEQAVSFNVRGAESGTITAATISENRRQIYTLSGTADRKLPTTGILAGEIIEWVNPTTYALTIKSSDGDTVETITKYKIKIVALQNTPTDATHWSIISAKSLYRHKTYIAGTAYTNGTPAITVGTGTISTSAGWMIPSQTIDGAWWLEFSLGIYLTGTVTQTTVSLSGIDIEETDGAHNGQQATACVVIDIGTAFRTSNAGYAMKTVDICYANAEGANFNRVMSSGKIRLKSKPTWMD